MRTIDGRVLEATVLHPRGSVEYPLSDQEIETKARDLAHQGGFGGSIDDVMAAVWQIDTMATIGPLIDMLGQD